MADAFAFANNDVVQIVWRYAAEIPGCLGFAVQRQDCGQGDDAPWVDLPAWVGFQGQNNNAWTMRSTDVWPVQKFGWKDLTATRGKTCRYRVVPASGEPSTEAPLHLDLGNAAITDPHDHWH